MHMTVDELDRVIDQSVRPHAEQVDSSGEFPRESLAGLAAAGVMGLPMAESAGGGGGELAEAVTVIRKLAGACGSTAMIVLMHYTAAAVIDRYGPDEVKKAIAAGEHLSTLAFSESGSRSQFWVPLGTARASAAGRVRLDAEKSWITAAGEADSYVWSSRPLAAEGPMTLWLVPVMRPVSPNREPSTAWGCEEPLGAGRRLRGGGRAMPCSERDGAGLDIALADVLPWFLVLNAAFSVGLMEAVTDETGAHCARPDSST